MDRVLRDDVRSGLTSSPKTLPPKWFYDETRLAVVRRHHPPAGVLPDTTRTRDPRSARRRHRRGERRHRALELGSGTSTKTRLLLDALRDAGTLRTFAPFDCSEATLRDAGD